MWLEKITTGWCGGCNVEIGTKGRRIDSRADQIGVANSSPSLRRFFGIAQALSHELEPTTRHTLRRNSASDMKIWFDKVCANTAVWSNFMG